MELSQSFRVRRFWHRIDTANAMGIGWSIRVGKQAEEATK